MQDILLTWIVRILPRWKWIMFKSAMRAALCPPTAENLNHSLFTRHQAGGL